MNQQSTDRSWLSIEGQIKPLSNGGSLHKLREKGNQFWFVLQDNSRLLYYNQRSSSALPNVTPEGSFGVSSGKLDIFVVLTSNDGKEYLLSPAKEVSFNDWLTNLKNKLNNQTSQSPFERGSLEQGGFMSRVRNSLRRKKKLGRSMSVDVTGQSLSMQISHAREEASDSFFTPELKHETPAIFPRKSKVERSKSCPFDDKIDNKNIMEVVSKVKTHDDKACDTSNRVSLDRVITESNKESVHSERSTLNPVKNVEPQTQHRKLLKVVNIDYPTNSIERRSLATYDTIRNRFSQTESAEEKKDDGEREVTSSVNHSTAGQTYITGRKGSLPVNQYLPRQAYLTQRKSSLPVNECHPQQLDTTQWEGNLPVNQNAPKQTHITQRNSSLSVIQSSLGQTNNTQDGICKFVSKNGQIDNTRTSTEISQASRPKNQDAEVENVYMAGMSLQQQKIIRELEIEVCKLKCEVVSLIQGTIKVPLKDDDLADWHYVEEIRYKDRIFELLREARLYNPNLPDLDSSNSVNFKDAYGFIHGSRESESIVFHFVCRELTQHYSSFFQNKTGHVKFWNEYTKSKKQSDERVLYREKEIKRLVQDGIPSSCRSKVWKSFISEKVHSIIASKGVNFYQKQAIKTEAKKNKLKSEMSEVERQIRCDLLRTMPSNEHFKSLESEPFVAEVSEVSNDYI